MGPGYGGGRGGRCEITREREEGCACLRACVIGGVGVGWGGKMPSPPRSIAPTRLPIALQKVKERGRLEGGGGILHNYK